MATLEFWKKVSLKLYEGIDILDKKAVLHRDLKPDNIYICYPSKSDKTVNVENFDPSIDFNIKIGDFGIARQVLVTDTPMT